MPYRIRWVLYRCSVSEYDFQRFRNQEYVKRQNETKDKFKTDKKSLVSYCESFFVWTTDQRDIHKSGGGWGVCFKGMMIDSKSKKWAESKQSVVAVLSLKRGKG